MRIAIDYPLHVLAKGFILAAAASSNRSELGYEFPSTRR
jgi:hypothetical protein